MRFCCAPRLSTLRRHFDPLDRIVPEDLILLFGQEVSLAAEC